MDNATFRPIVIMTEWKDIKDTGWKVSSDGDIMKPNGKTINFKSKGYRRCELGYVHLIVAYYFCNPPANVSKSWICEGYEVHHKDKDPSNNKSTNLVYLTHKEHHNIHKEKVVRPKSNKYEINRELVYDYLRSLRG